MGCAVSRPVVVRKSELSSSPAITSLATGDGHNPQLGAATSRDIQETISDRTTSQQGANAPSLSGNEFQQSVTALRNEWLKGELRCLEKVSVFVQAVQKALSESEPEHIDLADVDVLLKLNLVPLLIEMCDFLRKDNKQQLTAMVLEILEMVATKQPEYSIHCGLEQLARRVLLHHDVDFIVSLSAMNICAMLAIHCMKKRCLDREKELAPWRADMGLVDIETPDDITARIALTLLKSMILENPRTEFYSAATGLGFGENPDRDESVMEECLWTLCMHAREKKDECSEETLRFFVEVMIVSVGKQPTVSIAVLRLLHHIKWEAMIGLDPSILDGFTRLLYSCNYTVRHFVLWHLHDLTRTSRYKLLTENLSILNGMISASILDSVANFMRYAIAIFTDLLQDASSDHLQQILKNAPIIACVMEMSKHASPGKLQIMIYQMVTKASMASLVDNVFAHPKFNLVVVRDDPLKLMRYLNWGGRGLDDNLHAIWETLVVTVGGNMFQTSDGETTYDKCRKWRLSPTYECLRHLRVMALIVATRTLDRFKHVFTTSMPLDIYVRLHRMLIHIPVPRPPVL